MKIFFMLVSIFIVVAVLLLATINAQTAFDLTLWGKQVIPHTNLVQAMMILFIAGMFVGIFWVASFYWPLNEKIKEYQKKLEKTSVQSDEDTSKVAVLEEKIKTLEKALDEALNKNNE